MSNRYITLTDSSSNAYKFRVIFGGGDGYQVIYRKTANIKPTVTGKIDYQAGVVMREWLYVIRVYYSGDPNGVGWGVLSNLQTLFDSHDEVTLTDHYGTSYQVYMVGDLNTKPFTPQIESGAWFEAPIRLMRTEPE